MADPLAPTPPPEPPARTERPIARPRPRLGQQKTYTHRFRGAYVALAVVFWGIVAAGTVFLVRGTGDSGPAWSTWKPTESSITGASEIAAHIAPQYRRDDDRQLVAVRVHEPEVQNVPIAAVAVQSGSDVSVVPASKALVYELFGGGERGSIDTGQPSTERAQLLRREALELALYTFKYVHGIDSVIALLPPPPKSQTNWTLFIRKQDLKQQLERPLRDTLPATRDTFRPSTITPGESRTIEALTRPRWFNFTYQQAQDGNVYMVMKPVTASS